MSIPNDGTKDSSGFSMPENMGDFVRMLVALSLQAPRLDLTKHPMMALTSAVQDTTVVDRTVAALEKGILARCMADGVKLEDKPGEDVQDRVWGAQPKHMSHRTIIAIDNLPRLIKHAILPIARILARDQDLNLVTSEEDEMYNFVLVKGAGDGQASSSSATSRPLTTFVGVEYEDLDQDLDENGLLMHSRALAQLEALSREGLDLLFLKTLIHQVDKLEGRHAESVLTKMILRMTEAKNARFALLIATPYFLLAELGERDCDRILECCTFNWFFSILTPTVHVEGKTHLLLDRIYSAVDEGPDSGSSAPYRPVLAVLLALFMNHFPAFNIDGPGEDVKSKVREKTKELGSAYDMTGM
ncbi:BZ3500_MvSof-1268-A1-R1_Chr5-3g08341 [Microbotryum saponariae]|uniref:BZ3500_MvSof-1268-A1-R1_Chr5-3g08341 protein n=1 Tax=Microbotryum saponariae TaxID=289078 RepID=A0A2X0LR55_9BASI|nr:BZ3500_MvSof-1268-A1-R1_Chr5-3g08341 [Microbotryum saponariae]SDA08449.1 BZ3501_MvSof-1269-A2-R1_Chr5-3g08069 [Microbotryum saponariae]